MKNWECIPSPPDPRDYPFRFFQGEVPLPPIFAWSMPPVLNQGKWGTCVAFASVGVKNLQEKEQGTLPDGGLSPLYIYSRCKKLDGIPDQEGTYPRIAMKVLQEEGVCSEKAFPYKLLTDHDEIPQPKSTQTTEAKKYRVKTYARCNTVDEVKRAIVEQGPVLAAVLVTSSFLERSGDTVGRPEGIIMGGHAVVFYGYDDTRKAFLLRNSWGTSWGMDGSKWFPYDLFTYRLDDGKGMPALYECWSCVDVEWKPEIEPYKRHIVYELRHPWRKWKNGIEVSTTIKPTLINDHAYLPIREVGNDFDCDVDFDGLTYLAEIKER